LTENVFELSDRLFDDLVERSPIEATLIGVGGFDDRWDDFSPEGFEDRGSLLHGYLKRFSALPVPHDRWEALAVRVAREYLEEHLAAIDHGDHFRDLNTIASPLQEIREVFDHMDTSTEAGWENVAARMESIGDVLGGYVRTLEAGRRKDLFVAQRQTSGGARDARIHAGERSFFATAPERLRRWGKAGSQLQSRLETAARTAREAFAGFARYLEEEYTADAPDEDGVGADRHLRQTRRFLGMDIDPAETYRWGWTEVASLHERMKELARFIDPDASLAEVVQLLKTDPDRCAATAGEFVEIMRQRQELVMAELDGTHFDIPDPIKRLEVKVSPPGGSLGAYYVQPSEDFTRPGAVWYSLGKQTSFPLWDEVSTAYHEGFPGHHMQSGVQLSLADRLSRLHRTLIWHPGYGEGWALYAERLMEELGYLEKPEYVLGMLSAEMLRACRVVIDIGLHVGYSIPSDAIFHPGERWTFESAVEMLTDLAFLYADYASSEVTRYLGWPGQAISYKVGQRVILELREEMRSRHGTAFNLKEFHGSVLGSGPVGLAHLRELVLSA